MARPPRAVRLHSIRPADAERLATWLPDVAAEAGWADWANPDALSRSVHDPQVLTDDSSTAFLAYELTSPVPNAARVDFLAVFPQKRRLGIGGRTALAFERRLRGKAECVYTQVPASIGLALYFWLRLGYQPLTQADWPITPQPGPPSIWMKREL